ncbi:cupin [Nocardia sp. NPDC024068]|uniref:cupin n=1 Tax=Nocardia sp. NPDC024068 TaxID=3157197 RepID=UPI0033CC3325
MRPFISGFIVATITATGVAGAAALAGATSGSGITSEPLGQVWLPQASPAPGTDLVARRIVIQPGGSTGWHYHDGPVRGLVVAGTLTHPGPDCVAPEYPAGAVIDEPAGAWNIHAGFNLGAEPVVLYAVYASPAGKPLVQDAPAPACARSSEP